MWYQKLFVVSDHTNTGNTPCQFQSNYKNSMAWWTFIFSNKKKAKQWKKIISGHERPKSGKRTIFKYTGENMDLNAQKSVKRKKFWWTHKCLIMHTKNSGHKHTHVWWTHECLIGLTNLPEMNCRKFPQIWTAANTSKDEASTYETTVINSYQAWKDSPV